MHKMMSLPPPSNTAPSESHPKSHHASVDPLYPPMPQDAAYPPPQHQQPYKMPPQPQHPPAPHQGSYPPQTNHNNDDDNNNTDDVSAISAVTATSSPTKPNVCWVCCQTALSSLIKIIRQCVFQPPVLAAIAGFLVATFPKLRGIFVDIVDRDGDAPTQWFFDALYGVGQAAVPINMILLGSNLSQSLMRQQQTNDNATDGTDQTVSGSTNNNLLSKQTMAAVVFGKLVVMPLIGIGSVVLLSLFVWNLPQGKSGNGSAHDS